MIKVFDSLPSTNDYIRQNLSELEDRSFIIAREQTLGRGRLGRKWLSTKDKGLYFSVLLRPKKLETVLALPIVMGLALARAFVLLGFCPKIKWPNDLLVNDRKISGILTEFVSDSVIVGIGVNVSHKAEDFPDTLRLPATSIRMEGKTFDTMEVFSIIKDELLKAYDEFLLTQSVNEEVNKYLSLKPSLAMIEGNFREVKIKKITASGRLLVSIDGEERELESGELC